jgi:alkylation response protein AidB-like acyl-CoA dehydrogenase
MSDVLLSEADMNFLVFDWLKLEEHLEGTDFDRDTAEAYFELSRKLAAERFLPHYKKADEIEPRLEDGRVKVLPEIGDALAEFRELGLFGANFSEDLGGMGLPQLVTSASYAWFAAANGSSVGYTMLTGANARLIAAFGSDKQIDTFARPQIAGEWFGTMCLSEPQAGSGLGDVRTVARHDGEDELGQRYKLTGNKMWISGGDQDISDNIVHLVLAKIPDESGKLPEGTKGISLFIVPRTLPDGTTNDVAVAGLNHKMGNRGTSNCLLNFGENGGATGWIVGEPGHGLRQMFMMMNEARIAVGFGAAALACRGYLLAANYARERLQGRAPGKADGPPIAIIEHADVRRMLLVARSYAEGSMALCLLSSALVDNESDPEDAALLELLTPVTKTFPSEYGLKANDLAIQVHGGYGYTRDFDVEQLYRDNRLNPIHEGTTGIQAADLLGRKVLRGGAGLQVLQKRVAATVGAAREIDGLREEAEAVEAAIQLVSETIMAIASRPPAEMLDNAASFMSGFSLAVVAWIWLDQAVTVAGLGNDHSASDVFRKGKVATARYFIWHELPHAEPFLAQAASDKDTIMALEAEAF